MTLKTDLVNAVSCSFHKLHNAF